MSVLGPILGPVLGPVALSLTRAGVAAAFAELNLLAPTLDPRINFTRASTKTYIGADGLLHTAAANECPLEYDPVTLQPLGRSFWEARTNLVRNSSDFQSIWFYAGGVAVTPGAAIAPDGTKTATKVVLSGTTNHQFTQNLVGALTPGYTYTISGYVLSGNSAPDAFQLAYYDGSSAVDPSTASNVALPASNEWQRITFTFTVPAAAAVTTPQLRILGYSIGGDGQSMYLWGFQLEQAATPGPYIPTTTTTVTRAADVATVDDLSKLRFNPSEGTLYVEGQFDAADTSRFYGIATFNDGTTQSVIRLGKETNGKGSMFVQSANVVQAQPIAGAFPVASVFKIAGACKANDFNSAVNGVLGPVDSAGSIPAVSRLSIGSTNDSAQVINATIRRIRYYPRRLTDAELQALTA